MNRNLKPILFRFSYIFLFRTTVPLGREESVIPYILNSPTDSIASIMTLQCPPPPTNMIFFFIFISALLLFCIHTIYHLRYSQWSLASTILFHKYVQHWRIYLF